MRNKALAALAALLMLAGTAACSDNASTADQARTDGQLGRYQANQPVPSFDRSQLRETVIQVENAQVHGIATTTFFFNLGVPRPIKTCSSIGYPVPSTAQLTNPLQLYVTGSGSHDGVIGQMEPNGVYTGDSSGTYVVCVGPGGVRYISYWEGDVQTEGGPAHWDQATQMIVLDGPPTVTQR